MKRLLLPVLFCVFASLVPLTQRVVDRRLGSFRAQEEILLLWSGERLRRIAPGFHNLLADVYWLRTVQYFGGQRVFAREKRFDLLEPLIDVTVTLDPNFEIAYRYGAMFLAEPKGWGADDPEAAVELLDRGCRNNPQSWSLLRQKGFFIFLYLRDAQRASEAIWKASQLPDAPWWLQSFAASILIAGNERESARTMWRSIYEHAEEDSIMKKNARDHLLILDALDRADALAAVAERFTARVGRPPSTLDELWRTGLIRSPAVDPSGTPYRYDPANRTVRISEESPLYRKGFAGFAAP